MTATSQGTEASGVLYDAQGAFFVLVTVTHLDSFGGPFSNTGERKPLRPQCVECNPLVLLDDLRCDTCRTH